MSSRRRLLVLTGAAVWLAAAPGWTQYQVSARLAQSQVLQYEAVIVRLRVTNPTPYPLVVGGEGGATLSFRVEQRPGHPVDDLRGSLTFEPFLVPPRGNLTRDIDISSTYDMRNTGPYSVVARLDYRDTRSRSGKYSLTVVPGLVVHKERVIGRSGSRTVSLRTLQRDLNQHLFCRLEDETAKICYAVHDLGRVLLHDPQQILIDAEDRVHILHQSAPARYTHSIVKLDGTPVSQAYVSKETHAAKLAYADDGSVAVEGGTTFGGDAPVDRPRITTFNPFPKGLPGQLERGVPQRLRR